MANSAVVVPMSLFLDKQITVADKLVWMMILLDMADAHGHKLVSPTRLAQRTRLSRLAIYNSLKRLTAAGWYDGQIPIVSSAHPVCMANMPDALLRSTELQPRDIVVYGLMQDISFGNQHRGQLTYLALSKYAHLCVKTVRRAVQALAQAGWITVQQANKLAHIHFELADPRKTYHQNMERFINASKHWGEAISIAMVTFLLEQADYQVASRPNWLVNPDTGALMEVDLYIPQHNLVMEFNGQQHYQPTKFSSAAEVAAQQARDAAKVKILTDRKVKTLVLRDADLSLENIAKMLIDVKAPMRDLECFGRIKRYLDDVGRQYQKVAKLEKAKREAQKQAKELVQAQEQKATQQ